MESVMLAEERLELLLDKFNSKYGTHISLECFLKAAERSVRWKEHYFKDGITYELMGPLVTFKAHIAGPVVRGSSRLSCFIDRLFAEYPEKKHFKVLADLIKDGLAGESSEWRVDSYSKTVLYTRSDEEDRSGNKYTLYRTLDANGDVHTTRTAAPENTDTLLDQKGAVDINGIKL